MIGIADWLATELEVLGVDVRLNAFVEGPEVLADSPEVVLVASGGVPDANLEEGGELAVSTWELLSGETSPGENILVYDETGGHGAIATADWLATNGASVEMATPDLQVGRNIGGQNIPVYLRNLYISGATLTPNHRLKGIRRDGNALVATLWNDFSRVRIERRFDQIVVDTCTVPADGPFHELAAGSRNLGDLDVDALVRLEPQPDNANPGGDYLLFRIGDALAQRDIHAAMLDANRLCRVL